ncbi:MAG: ATP synthase F1 subunit epsilon [Hymenobacteraceae bacterium]|nr:ATP synthase F1 subunit epsilon [Hymenobacteraceae bacterium]MDX5398002.1 ATP synthase F1 subunit epsilon [Hymenobacteraceae bacterium]MDX5444397.1 ATP synthase F1 subunit epsilon [Hymenobacteraceae bacterium]MDX5514074.1 ATP synthase F1 subunit epsilon [Hymenobacteraceae bacterium]
MFLEIITPDKKVFEGEVTSAQFPGSNGSFEVLDNHAPVISTLDRGQIRIITNSGNQFFQVESGVVEVLNNNIIVLVESVTA